PRRAAHCAPRRRAAGARGDPRMTDTFEPLAEASLSGLREAAPPGLAHSTLVAVGLADDYAVMASPIGPLRVAWNARGVSTVEEAPDDGTFETRFHARTGRVARRGDTLPAALGRQMRGRLACGRANR